VITNSCGKIGERIETAACPTMRKGAKVLSTVNSWEVYPVLSIIEFILERVLSFHWVKKSKLQYFRDLIRCYQKLRETGRLQPSSDWYETSTHDLEVVKHDIILILLDHSEFDEAAVTITNRLRLAISFSRLLIIKLHYITESP
jgi:hypothetical protein